MAEIKNKRVMVNTTISEPVADDFRRVCKEINCPMNMVLETFMRQFADGQFTFKLCRGKTNLDIEEE